MKICSIIAEFNPFHTGHRYLVGLAKKSNDAVIAIMSGNFVQRGECAVFEKSARASKAVENGIDLVIELPLVYSLSSAEGFAHGAVSILDKCAIVSELWFGSECGDTKLLTQAAQILNNETDIFKKALKEKLDDGCSFPKARQFAFELCGGEPAALSEPNNILGVEYIRSVLDINSDIIPHSVKRTGGGCNDTNIETDMPSASAIRNAMSNGNDVSPYIGIYPHQPVFMSDFDMIAAARLKTISRNELCSIPDCNDEIASRLKDADVNNSINEIISNTVCRRYTESRIRRILCNMIVANTFRSIPSPSYIRPLAFNKTGAMILREMKTKADLPIISRGAAVKNDPIFELECRGSDIYNLIRGICGNKELSFAPIKML